MSETHLTTIEYRDWLKEIKQRLRQAQVKAAVQVNTALLTFYWELGADIVERQKTAQWGSGFLKQMRADLMAEFPDMKGFSRRNLERIRMWHLFYSEGVLNCDTACVAIGNQPLGQLSELDSTEAVPQPVAQKAEAQKVQRIVAQIVQIPWSHNLVIISKCKNVTEALYYVHQTIAHNWSRNVLTHQIESDLYLREGKAVTNFAARAAMNKQTARLLEQHFDTAFAAPDGVIPFYAFSCTYIKQLLTDNRIHTEMGGLPVFALFDFDKAYDQWNGLNGTVSETDPLKGMIKKWAEGESYVLMLPVPANADIQKQVIRNAETGETFGGDSCCEIKHLFYGIDATKNYYQQEPCVGGTKIVFKSDGEKTAFAKKVVPTLDSACFEVFRPLFEFIKSKCPAGAEGEEVTP